MWTIIEIIGHIHALNTPEVLLDCRTESLTDDDADNLVAVLNALIIAVTVVMLTNTDSTARLVPLLSQSESSSY